MGSQIQLGQREGQSLEFKGADSVKKPFSISREVVAMLNAGGGEIWIGVREANGFAVEVEGLPDADRRKVDLLNHLIEVVEPRLRAEDVRVEVVELEGRRVLQLLVAPGKDRGPFAQLKEGGRHFVRRVDHRIRPMTREEILESEAQIESSPVRLKELREGVLKRSKPGLWVGVQPLPALRIDVQAKELEGFLLDPTKSGNRMEGWSFRYPPMAGIRPTPNAGRIEFGRDDYHKTTVWEDGCIEFWTTLEGLHHRTDSIKEIYPHALLEYPVAVMRLAKHVYDELGTSRPNAVFVDVALTQTDDWYLPAFPPETYGYRESTSREKNPVYQLRQRLDDGQFLPASPLMFTWEEFRADYEQAGYLLVRSIYQAFHLPEDRISHEYDRMNRRLVFKD